MSPKVFFITGTSTGFGAELVNIVLANGNYAVATARNPENLVFKGTNDKNHLAVALDVTKNESIDRAFKAAIDKFGRVDVVVNNAGYGLSGEFEGLADEQIRQQFEVNFFGLINVTRKAMEVMRELKTGGMIQQVTSIGGQRGAPLFSVYCASKWAVEGFTESISKEVKPEWNIRFQCIEFGGFRTDWAGRSMDFGQRHPAYDHLNAREALGKRNGTQAGDPTKGAQAQYELALMEDPPLRCVVGTDAFKAINEKMETYKESIAQYEKISTSTDFDQ